MTSTAFNVVPHDLIFKSVLPAPPAKAGATGSPLAGPGGAWIEVDPYDAEANIDSSYTGTITLTLNTISLTNKDGKAASLLGATGSPVPSVQMTGKAGTTGVKFTNVIISEPGEFTLTATAPEKGAPGGKITGTSDPFIVGSDTPVIVTAPPQYIGANESFAAPIVVQVENSSNEIDTSFTGDVTMSLVGTSSVGKTPALGGTLTVQAKAGVASFPGLSVNLLGTAYKLEAQLIDGTKSNQSDSFSVVPETLKFLASEYADPAGVPGDAISPPIQLGVYLQTGTDGGLTLDTQFNNQGKPFTLSLGQNPTGATIQNASGTISNGIVTFNQLSFGAPSGSAGFTLVPSDGNPNDTGIPSPAIVIVPHTLSFDSAFEPVNSIVNQAMQQIIVVNVNDLSGGPDPNYNGQVTLTLEGGELVDPDTGQLTNSITATAIGGRAHFFHPAIGTTGTLIFSASIDEPDSDTRLEHDVRGLGTRTGEPEPSGQRQHGHGGPERDHDRRAHGEFHADERSRPLRLAPSTAGAGAQQAQAQGQHRANRQGAFRGQWQGAGARDRQSRARRRGGEGQAQVDKPRRPDHQRRIYAQRGEQEARLQRHHHDDGRHGVARCAQEGKGQTLTPAEARPTITLGGTGYASARRIQPPRPTGRASATRWQSQCRPLDESRYVTATHRWNSVPRNR